MKTLPNAASRLKIFAMTNQLLEADLDAVEREHSVDLGRGHMDAVDKDDAYYPQFDEQLRREAAAMSDHYEIFYCLERSIRAVISETLEAADGLEWWEKGRIPQRIQDDVSGRVQREIDSAVTIRSTDPIDYTTFGELSEIIKVNWDLFGAILNSKRAVEKVMANLNTLRGPIAHCSMLAEDEIVRLQLSLRDWFRLME